MRIWTTYSAIGIQNSGRNHKRSGQSPRRLDPRLFDGLPAHAWPNDSGIPRLLLLIRLGLLRGYRRERAEQAVELIVRASSEKQCGGWTGVAIVAKS